MQVRWPHLYLLIFLAGCNPTKRAARLIEKARIKDPSISRSIEKELAITVRDLGVVGEFKADTSALSLKSDIVTFRDTNLTIQISADAASGDITVRYKTQPRDIEDTITVEDKVVVQPDFQEARGRVWLPQIRAPTWIWLIIIAMILYGVYRNRR